MINHRSAGRVHIARALWYTQHRKVELRPVPVDMPEPGALRLRMLFSGISRGTERLIFNGCVSESEFERMQAPFQVGAFPFPVKYGYCATAVVEIGPDELIGREVFCLHPHQDIFVVPITAVTPLPSDVPARRATLAANMETALNGLWDSGVTIGDKITIIGAGVLGLLIAHLAARIPGTDVTLIDIDADREQLANEFGATFMLHESALEAGEGDADVVFHTTATSDGINLAINQTGHEGSIVEMSWYGKQTTAVNLGGAFHSKRLRLISSQVGQLPPNRERRWTHKKRIAKALDLLKDPVLDQLVASHINFDEAVTELPKALSADAKGLAPVIQYR